VGFWGAAVLVEVLVVSSLYHAVPGKSSSKRRSSDIISLLVSIYGSKDLFINEYRSLLADRLLHQFSFSPER
jgi:anaphase-promoting complex subunit 2